MRIHSLKAFILAITVLILPLVSHHNTAAGKNSIVQGQVIYTNSLNGNIDYCHCKDNPNGGLVKRATAIKTLREKNGDLLLCSTGDLFTYNPDPVLAGFIVKSLDHIDYDAICPGDQEMTVGTDSLLQYSNTLPFICANLQVCHKGKWISPGKKFTVVQKNNIKYGITGIIHPSVFRYYSKEIKNNTRITSPGLALKKAIASLTDRRVDCILLLSHSGISYDRKLAKTHSEIDIIIGGHSQTLVSPPEKVGNTIIVQAGAGGARIGILDITVKNGNITRYSNRFIRPDEHQPADDPRIRELIQQYHEKVSDKYKGLRFD